MQSIQKQLCTLLLILPLGLASASGQVDTSAWADVLCSYEYGLNPVVNDEGDYTHPNAVFQKAVSGSDDEGIVCLGNWTDDPSAGTGNPVGIIVGFSQPMLNGLGNDLFIQGNATNGWYEPGYVEVARESSGGGATADGWMDETFYLLKPGNYDLVGDPRLGPLTIQFNGDAFNPGSGDYGTNPYLDDAWKDKSALTGYADVNLSGDYMDLDWAIDMAGDSVSLADIAYVRIRTVSDSPAGMFGSFSSEIDYIKALNGFVPEPATMFLLTAGGLLLCKRKKHI